MAFGPKRGHVVENVDANAMHEIFKHLDAQTFAVASCVSKRWHDAAIDENLWGVICTKQWPTSATGIERLRCVVNVMGGFRRLYVKWLRILVRVNNQDVLWSEDHVHLSLSLFSVDYFEKLRTTPISHL